VPEEKIICIGCPLGCLVTLKLDAKGEVAEVTDAKCKEGQKYVVEEYKNPVRVLTATVLTEKSTRPLLSVRTSRPVPKKMLADAMLVLAQAKAKPPMKLGQVVIPNLLGTGADLVATADLPD